MLNDFLVLGQIPGTKIQITFTQLLLVLGICLLAGIATKMTSIQRLQRTPLNFGAQDSQQLSLLLE